jgi:putative transposase
VIDALRDDFGVEPVCRELGLSASAYYARRARPPSPRQQTDAHLLAHIRRVHEANYGVYGARRVWHQLRREGIQVARCTVERLMHAHGIRGVIRGQRRHTTVPDPAAARPADLVRRDFHATAPDRLWVADLTYVRTFTGWVYVAFILDAYSRMIVGWQIASHLRTDLALDALEMAVWTRKPQPGPRSEQRLVHHSDRGVQGGFNWSSQHLEILGVCDGALSGGCGSGCSAGDEVAGASCSEQGRGEGVLVSDRGGFGQRGRCGGGRRVGAGRDAVVSPRWRYATVESCRAVGPIPVL